MGRTCWAGRPRKTITKGGHMEFRLLRYFIAVAEELRWPERPNV